MNYQIAKHLQERLSTIPWLAGIDGLVYPVKKDIRTADSTRTITMPVPADKTEQQCMQGDLLFMRLAPDEKKPTVAFFEDRGVFETSKTVGNSTETCFVAHLRLIVWLNMEWFDFPGTKMTYVMVPTIYEQLQGFTNFNGLKKIQMTSFSEVSRDPQIFARYDFDRRFTFYPFDFFAIDMQFEFDADSTCMPPIVLKTSRDGCAN